VRESGRGAVLATAHAGNWELAAAAIAEAYPLTVVAKSMSLGWVDRFCREARLARGMAVVSPRGALGAARAALAHGRLVAMLIDQVPARARHAVSVDFLCGSADVDRSPATLAASASVPLVVAVSRRVGSVQRLEVLGVFEPPASGRLDWAAETTRSATRLLDRWIHAHPSEWLWMHRRWRPAPGPAPKGPGSPAYQAGP
jgi:KDO2-lipid IV(A) lauroyltransferase